jgi:hypothetical protein
MTFSRLAVAVADPPGMRAFPLGVLRLLAAAGLLVATLAPTAPIHAQEQDSDIVAELSLQDTGTVAEPESAEPEAPAEPSPETSDLSLEEPAASPVAEGDLWAQISNRQTDMKSARMDGAITATVLTEQGAETVPVTVNMTMQGAVSGEDFDVRMNMQVDALPDASNMDLRMILVGDTAFLNMQDTWMPIPRSQAVGQLPGRAELPQVSGEHVTLTLLGQDEVRGVPCDVYAFVVDPSAVTDVMHAALVNPQSAQGRIDAMSGDVCVGSADGFTRRMNLKMRMIMNPPNAAQGEVTMDMDMAFDMFDINSPDIVIITPPVSRMVPDEGKAHVQPGTPITHASRPPSSGTHYPTTSGYGVFEKEIDSGYWVHTLEHGGIVVLYQPDRCDAKCLDQLRQVHDSAPQSQAFGKVKMAVIPYRDMDHTVASVAWGRVDEMDQVDSDRILTFYRTYVDKGPELAL